MKSLYFNGSRSVGLEDRPVTDPQTGFVRLKLRVAGVCGSDLHGYRSPSPSPVRGAHHLTPGHEPSGVIDAIGEGVSGWSLGDPVAAHASHGCGTCEECLRGSNASCASRLRSGLDVDGSDAEYILLPARNLVRLPDENSFIEGMLIACNVGTAYQAIDRLAPKPGEHLVVFGAGPVGCAAAMIAKARDAHVTVVEPSQARLDFALSLGADTGILAGTQPVVPAVQDITGGLGADIALDCSGSTDAELDALRVVRYWGRVGWVGMNQRELTIDPKKLIIEKQLTLIGSTMWPKFNYETMMDFIQRHDIEISRLVTHRATLDDAESAFRTADSPEFAGKVAFVFD